MSEVRFASSASKRSQTFCSSCLCFVSNRRKASSAESWATRAKSFTPRRSSTSVRFSLPAPEHRGHSIVSFTKDDSLLMGFSLAGIDDHYFFRLISKPGSLELREAKLPCSSRVQWNRSLVRPRVWPSSSRTTEDSSSKPVVTDPMTRRFPSRTYSFFSIGFSLSALAIYKAKGGNDYL